jgi:hypothetical protein
MDLVLCHHPTACGPCGLSRTAGAKLCPVACDIVPARHIYPIEVSDLNAFRFIPILISHFLGTYWADLRAFAPSARISMTGRARI